MLSSWQIVFSLETRTTQRARLMLHEFLGEAEEKRNNGASIRGGWLPRECFSQQAGISETRMIELEAQRCPAYQMLAGICAS